MVRLRQSDIDGIKRGAQEALGLTPHRILLFGSRVEDSLRGGDIDLLILCDSQNVRMVQEKKARVVLAIQERIGERRIDCTIGSTKIEENSDFVRSIVAGAVEL